MEFPSYPDSRHSSPRSRDIDYENSLSSWEDSLNRPSSPAYHKVKFMCSYGGKILPRPHDNQLSYVGGETKIISVDRNIKFPALVAKLSSFGVLFKYQLPGEDLDALISVTNDEDLENLMQEYDRIYKLSSKPTRLRLFLFGVQPTPSTFGSEDTKSEKERFVEALNSVAPPPPPPPQAVGSNMDFLFGLEKSGIETAPPPPPPVAPPNPIQNHIQDLQRFSIEEEHQGMWMYGKRNENDVVVSGGFTVHGGGSYYFPNIQDNVSAPATVSIQPGAGFPRTEPPYMIQNRQGAYDHYPQMMRPVTGPPPTTNQGYYTLQNLPLGHSNHLNVSPIVAPPQIQPPVKATAYSEGYRGVIRPPGSGGGYTQVACDNYGGGVMAAPPPAQQQQYHQGIGASGLSGGEVKALNQKPVDFVGKLTHGSV